MAQEGRSARTSRTKAEPINPAPPVTKSFFMRESFPGKGYTNAPMHEIKIITNAEHPRKPNLRQRPCDGGERLYRRGLRVKRRCQRRHCTAGDGAGSVAELRGRTFITARASPNIRAVAPYPEFLEPGLPPSVDLRLR